MDGYFRAVDDYVDLVEGKVGEIMAEYAKIGMTPAAVRIFFKDFFDKLGHTTQGKDPIQQYFKLVDYYIATAESVLRHLIDQLELAAVSIRKLKLEQKTSVLSDIVKIQQLENAEEYFIATIAAADELLQSDSPYSIAKLRAYYEGDELDHELQKYVAEKWAKHNAKITKFVQTDRLMHTYGEMKKKFTKLEDELDRETLPLDTLADFNKARILFDSFNANNAIVRRHKIVDPLHKEYDLVSRKYQEGLKETKRILLYLQGGVSQAFLILRNTNDVKPRHDKEEHKLLKRVVNSETSNDELVYLNLDKSPIARQTNNFQEVFDDATPRNTINNAILSDKNYNLLQQGGTVSVVAYGQSGTGKTYTLTGLIEHISSTLKAGFQLDGVTAVQFYNDVMLEGGKRLTANYQGGAPSDPAERAEYKKGLLTQADSCEAMYNKTKMYDVGKLVSDGTFFRLKIEPVVTPVPDFATDRKNMLDIVKPFSESYFKAATEVNRLATSDPKLNRLVETYRQLVRDYRHQRMQSVLEDAHQKFCRNEFYLPVFKLDGTNPEIMTIQEAGQKQERLLLCGLYGIRSFEDFKFKISENDLNALIYPTMLTDKSFKARTERILTTCLETNVALLQTGRELIKQFEVCLLNRIRVHIFTEYVFVDLVSPDVYKVDTLYFNNGQLSTHVIKDAPKEFRQRPSRWKKVQVNTYKLTISSGRYKGFSCNLHDLYRFSNTHSYNKDGSIDFKFPYRIRMKKWGEGEIIFTKRDNYQRFYIERYQPFMTLEPYVTIAEAETPNDLLEEIYRLDAMSMAQNIQSEDATFNPTIHLSSSTWKFLDLGFLESWRHGSAQSMTFELEKHRYDETVEKSKEELGVIEEEPKIVPGKSKFTPIPKETVCPDYTIDQWEEETTRSTYDYYATLSQKGWETNLQAFRAKFEHCIHISATGPDNASNYALFDHQELRYKNYFQQYEAQIKTAYVDFDNELAVIKCTKEGLKDVYDKINDFRFTRAMPQNPESSRSQLVTTLHLSNQGVKSKLVFIDLAGNEKVDTRKKHIVTSESVYINSTLKFVTDMFLRMKEEYPGWKVKTGDDGRASYTLLKNPKTVQHKPPTRDQFDYNKPGKDADPFQRYLFQMSSATNGLKPAIVMAVCAYEYYSSWYPPIPSPDVSKESLKKTFEFISDLFHFGDQIERESVAPVQIRHETYRGGTTRRRKKKTRGRRIKGRTKRVANKTHKDHTLHTHIEHEEM
jgi:hypothetical protein